MAFPNTLKNVLSPLVTSLAPYHLLFYSTLLGTELYQSFVMTKVAFLSLPRSAFTTLQKKVFPIYFRGQAALLFLTALTIPPSGIFSIVTHKAYWVPFTIAGMTSILNLFVYEPRTRKAMIDCIHQETRDARQLQSTDGGNAKSPSDEMKRLNKIFSKNHAMSIHLNLMSIGAMIFYGLRLASRLTVDDDI